MIARPPAVTVKLAEAFRPFPLLGNAHVQTLLGQVHNFSLKALPSRVRVLRLPDNDHLLLHDSSPDSWQAGDPIAVIVHGLGGSHRSPTCVRITPRLLRHGVRVVRLDLRGAGEGVKLATKSYHAGLTQDIRAALADLHQREPQSPLWLVGISLGGNVVLKLAGEAAFDPVPRLERVATVAPPVDLTRCCELIEQPKNRIYDRFFAGLFMKQVARQRRYHPEIPRLRVPRPISLRGFDEAYTAPTWGFDGAYDYFRKAAAAPWLKHIQIPTFILVARDDPFICADSFGEYPRSQVIDLEIAEAGGHLGFLGRDGAGGIRWAERRVAEWLVGPV